MLPLGSRRLAGSLALLLAAGATQPAHAQEPAACDLSARVVTDCQLDPWTDDQQANAPSPFGVIDGTAWLEDARGDVPADGLDVQAVGIGTVDITDPTVVRDLPGLLKAGKVKQAVRPGQNILIRVVLDGPLEADEGAVDDAAAEAPDATTDGYAGIHVATDIDRSRSNNAPVGVGQAEQPFGGSEDIYSVTYASTTGQTQLLDSDLSRGWYEDRDAFAAAWAAPGVLDILVRPEGIGAGLRVVSFASGADGGYDVVGLGTGAIPVDGRVGVRPICIEASIVAEPFVVRRLIENGQMLRNVEATASWRGGAAFRTETAAREALASLVEGLDEDGDGVVALGAGVDLFEDGAVMGQRPEVSLALEGDEAQLGLELGLTRRGYEVLRAIKIEPTGDPVVDAWLEAASDAFLEAMPPFRSGRRGGTLIGEAMGSCVPALAP